ncbi:Bis, putative [Pediculus humanus corporis]|uniref:Bis(5'-nucleosyl)-tetraphosphatase [asymmetrical] n=1 Tax=Pediculus humanus subsp. corporis TaxID=121224 RepID=E0VH71_PEDHC|nr:Bis, putative [Pediculus humanus corporis]EEB12727.1 Bis, putative [Pediculus humanus corporis]
MEKKAAGFIIFRKISDNFEYLLLQASYGTHHWTPPKGHVEPGESEMEAALRETKEEAGFEKDDLKIYKNFQRTLRYTANGTRKTVVYWLADLYKNTPVTLSSEHQAYKWGILNEASKLCHFKDFEELLKDCEEFLKKDYNKYEF